MPRCEFIVFFMSVLQLFNPVVLQILEVKTPIKQTKVDKNKNIDCDKVITGINITHILL